MPFAVSRRYCTRGRRGGVAKLVKFVSRCGRTKRVEGAALPSYYYFMPVAVLTLILIRHSNGGCGKPPALIASDYIIRNGTHAPPCCVQHLPKTAPAAATVVIRVR